MLLRQFVTRNISQISSQQHSHGKNIRDHVSRLVHGLRVPDVVPAAGAGRELWGVGPRAARSPPGRGRPGAVGVGAGGASPARRRCLRRPSSWPRRPAPAAWARLERVIPAPRSVRASLGAHPPRQTFTSGGQVWLNVCGTQWTGAAHNKGNGHRRF